MTSFKDIRTLLSLFHDDGLIHDDEFLFLHEQYSSTNPDFPYHIYPAFDLDELDESECLAEFRFRKRDIVALRDILQIPAIIECEQRSVCDGVEGLCILLRRLSYPCRYGDMLQRFAKPVPILCMVANKLFDHIYNHHGYRVTEWNHDILAPVKLQTYVDAITAKGAPLENCFGFVDGTVRPISRPGANQRLVYNGHKRVHALKFLSVALPNGLIGNIYGPVGKCNLNYYLSFRKPEISVVVVAVVITTIIIIVMKITLIFGKHTENVHRRFQHETTQTIFLHYFTVWCPMQTIQRHIKRQAKTMN